MELLPAHAVRRLPSERIAWRIGDEGLGYLSPGRGEDRIPAFHQVFLPHLLGETRDQVWITLRSVWTNALEQVKAYSTARRRFDSVFASKMDSAVKQAAGSSLEADWSDVAIANAMVSGQRYQATVIRDRCESWYAGDFSRPGRTWFHPAIASANMLYGASWAITESNSSITFLWGGSGMAVPPNVSEIPDRLDRALDQLRFDIELKQLFEASEEARLDAQAAVEPLRVAAEDATHLLGHGPDIPGECDYCKEWKPRF